MTTISRKLKRKHQQSVLISVNPLEMWWAHPFVLVSLSVVEISQSGRFLDNCLKIYNVHFNVLDKFTSAKNVCLRWTNYQHQNPSICHLPFPTFVFWPKPFEKSLLRLIGTVIWKKNKISLPQASCPVSKVVWFAGHMVHESFPGNGL